MIRRTLSYRSRGLICALGVIAVAAVPSRAVPLDLDLRWGASLSGHDKLDLAPRQIGETKYQATGTYFGPNEAWRLEYEILADTDPLVQAVFSITNQSATNTQTYSLTVSMPVTPALAPPNLMGGSVTGSLTDTGGGAMLTSNGATAVYTALINGVPVQTLLDSPYSVSAGAFQGVQIGPLDFGVPIPSAAAPNVSVDTIGIQLQFTLSPGDSASFTSVFVVEPVPEPTTMALLGLVSLAMCRRRSA
ncbi:MAG TPA: PEP-CTERM sorting domain-containing protein [Phycisphaerae bacterium]|jgi:hypothetical protein|nr:PEP-CTERM sorting domain-containing protein [Phycisphaerae bacterium]HOB74670.1 PEP-CTERM sorting domain-containing protein [Phycisphaerae bacterium]HOJ53617.1 PEP-CTERM sorting domain-containing protein [Phycisphaerae bacterium]HOL26342.1 PEP-CTERM sorting domain-containing protein [Phycisphaerae bacterium]HPP22505.1 PEP-CTERM sorting domain-containing protein [Phycisphaerae bacterium]